jgi:hypothetical protein
LCVSSFFSSQHLTASSCSTARKKQKVGEEETSRDSGSCQQLSIFMQAERYAIVITYAFYKVTIMGIMHSTSEK